MRNMRLFAAAMLTMAVLGPTPILAATGTPPTIVQNQDEPGRTPYQEGMDGACQFAGDCALAFSTVTGPHRRVIDHITCRFIEPTSGTLLLAYLGTQNFRVQKDYLPLGIMVSDGTYSYVSVNLPTEVYFDKGEQPRIDAFTAGAALATFSCTLTGHTIDLSS